MNYDMNCDSDYDYDYEGYESDNFVVHDIESHAIEIQNVDITYCRGNNVIIGKYIDNTGEYVYIKIYMGSDGLLVFTNLCTDNTGHEIKSSNVYNWILKDRYKDKKYIDMNKLIEDIIETFELCLDTCIICNKALPCSVLRPSICNSDMCVYQMSVLGIGFSLEDYIMDSFLVVKLLIDFYIHTIGIKNDRVMFDKPNFVTDMDKLDTVIKEMDLSDLGQLAESNTLRHVLSTKHPDLYNTLQWIVSGNRCHISHVLESKIKDTLQYKINTLCPEKEAVFQENARKHGTIHLFHGSPLYCWHSIVRNGLKNMSKTKFMVNGAAHGEGIYLSKNINVATGYSKTTEKRCVILCEVIDRYKVTDFCCVVNREEDIKLKYVFMGGKFPNSVDIAEIVK